MKAIDYVIGQFSKGFIVSGSQGVHKITNVVNTINCFPMGNRNFVKRTMQRLAKRTFVLKVTGHPKIIFL